MLARPAGLYTVTTESPNVVTPGDELFFNLDRTTLDVGGESWNVEVCGVHSDGLDYWIQANLHGFVTYSVTFRTHELDVADIRKTLAEWLPSAPLLDHQDERVVSIATA
jgi:hypothetical protein